MAGILSGELGSQIAHANRRATAQFSAAIAVQIAALRLRIKKNEITANEAIEEIESVRRDFPEVFASEGVDTWIQWAIDCLNGETPLHGSMLDQQSQREEREALRRGKHSAPKE